MGDICWAYTQTGLTGELFAVISDPTATKRWNGTGWENYNPANWANYLRLLTEDPPGGLEYRDPFPAAITTVAAYPIQFVRGEALGPAEASGVYYGSGAVEYSAEEWAARISSNVVENSVLSEIVNDGFGRLLTATRRYYATPEDAELNDGVTGLISESAIVADYDSDGQLAAHTQKQIL